MSHNSKLQQARSLLPRTPEVPTGDSLWSRFLGRLLNVSAETSDAWQTVLSLTPLGSPAATARQTPGQLQEQLTPIPRGGQKASVVHSVAEWWMTEFGDERNPEWPKDLSFYRSTLRALRGLGPATADTLILEMGLRVMPMTRSVLRVAVRHGWLDVSTDEETAQSTLVSREDSAGELLQFFRQLEAVGETYCGRVPRCDGCPLQPELPSGGPLDPGCC